MSQIEGNEDIIEVEDYAKTGRTPPKGRQYRIRVDKQLIVVPTETVTGREILRLGGKLPPERFSARPEAHWWQDRQDRADPGGRPDDARRRAIHDAASRSD
jgi:hypothetical protein